MKKSLRITLIVIVAIVLAAVAFFFNRYLLDKEPQGLISSNARLQMQRLDVAGLYAGKVEEIHVQEGDYVKKGQVLVSLESDQYNNKLKGAEAQKQSAQSAVRQAQSQVAAEQEQLNIAQLELKDARALHKDNLVSNSELQHRRMAVAARTAAVQAAKAAEERAKAAVEQAQAQTDAISSSSNSLDIAAPVDGVIQYRYAQLGNVIAAGHPVVSMLNPTDTKITIYLSTKYVSSVHLGDEGRLKLDGTDSVWPVKVSFIADDSQFTPKYVETAEERQKMTYRVELTVPSDIAKKYTGHLKSGMTAQVWLKEKDKQWPETLSIKLPQQ